MKKCLADNKDAKAELYKKFAPKMYGVVLRFAKNKMDADDRLQEGFIKVLTNLKSFRNDGSLEGWIRRVIVNTTINHYKKETKKAYLETMDDIVSKLPAKDNNDSLSQLSVKELLKSMQELPVGYRTVFNLNTFDGYSHKEISDKMNISVNTSKSQLSRAKSSLQEKITSLFRMEEQKINLSFSTC